MLNGKTEVGMLSKFRDHLVFLSPASRTRNEETEEKQARRGRRGARRGGGILAAAQRQL